MQKSVDLGKQVFACVKWGNEAVVRGEAVGTLVSFRLGVDQTKDCLRVHSCLFAEGEDE